MRTTLNLVKVAKNRPAEVISANIPKFSMFIIYYEEEEKLNDLQGFFCQDRGDLGESAGSVLGPHSVGMTQGCATESGMGNMKAGRC